MLTPDQFVVSEAWIALRINEAFLYVKDEPYDVYVLMDAASTYVLGNMLVRVVDEMPQESDVENLFAEAWRVKNEWPERLIIEEKSLAESVFRGLAEKNGLPVEIIPLSELEPIVGALKEAFASSLGRDAI